MRIKVIGIAHNSGEFQGKPFDSVRIYGETDGANMICGTACFAASCNASAFQGFFGVPLESAEMLLGASVMLVTNKFNKITDAALL